MQGLNTTYDWTILVGVGLLVFFVIVLPLIRRLWGG